MLKVESGLADCQVLQRGPDGFGIATLLGRCASEESGDVEAQIAAGTYPVQRWRVTGLASAGKWHAELNGIPTGGPYRIELRIEGKPETAILLKEVFVGDLWILAGQSNMEGAGDLIDVEKPHPLVHSYGMDGRWNRAEEPLHWICDSPDPVHADQAEPAKSDLSKACHASRTTGAGLGLAFGAEIARRTRIPVGLLPCAHGGTSMAEWDPALRTQGGLSLYGSLHRRVKAVGGRVRGVLWYQGESDADAGATAEYWTGMESLIAALRADFDDAELPVFCVQIGRWVAPSTAEGTVAWNKIQDLQRGLTEISNVSVVAAVDLELADAIHVGTQGLRRLGRRLAHVAWKRLFEDEFDCDGPSVQCATIEDLCIRVSFAGVNGGFADSPRISGFSIRDVNRTDLSLVYNVTVDPKRRSDILLHVIEPLPSGSALWYGFGTDPYCNLVDAADMAAIVFGPISLD